MPIDPATPVPPDEADAPAPGVARQTVELLVALCAGVLLFRTFSAEAYVVPTGSMAPTLLGHHLEVTCPNCQFPFDVGLDDEAPPPRPVCPNCGRGGLESEPALPSNGDRVLVQKFLYDFRAPERWEVAVFHYPGDPSQAYVKRVVGLPGESIRLSGGDVWVDGVVARKGPQDVRAMRILVHDGRYAPADSDRYPRWEFRRGDDARAEGPSGWSRGPEGFRRAPTAAVADVDDWLVYRNWDPGLGRYAPIRDYYGYNGGDGRSDNAVRDVGLEARVQPGPGVRSLALALRSGGDRFVVRIPTRAEEPVEVTRNGVARKVFLLSNPMASGPAGQAHTVEASVFDARLMVLVDGSPLFEPLDYDDPAETPWNDESPVALGVRGGSLDVPEFRIYRDVHYTSNLGAAHRRPSGVLEPVRLGPGEYFVLGDNSPVSNDSRFWSQGPVVRRELFLGKPFLVHLPGRAVALEVFGRSLYWIPDPRRIRYIH